MPLVNPDSPAPSARRENPWLNLGVNLLIPVLLLKNGPSWFGFTPVTNLLVALAFPFGYFVWDAFRRRKANLISILGFVSVLLTGGIGVLELPRSWFIAKEGGLPLLLGLAILVSLKTRYPLVKTFLYNDILLDIARIDSILETRHEKTDFQRLMTSSTWIIASSFFFSSVVQFILASLIVTVEPAEAPELFNAQVGDMTWISYLVILVPSMGITFFALCRLIRGLEKLTDLTFEELLAPQLRQQTSPDTSTQ